jgi:hypothetical protein
MTFTISQDKKGGGRVRPVKSNDSDSDKSEQQGKDSDGQKRQRRSANKFLSKVRQTLASVCFCNTWSGTTQVRVKQW